MNWAFFFASVFYPGRVRNRRVEYSWRFNEAFCRSSSRLLYLVWLFGQALAPIPKRQLKQVGLDAAVK